MPATFDKILGKPLLHTHSIGDITGLSSDSANSVSTNQTLDSTSPNIILVNTSTSATSTVNINLPQSSTVTNRIFKIKKTDSSTKTITIIPYIGDQIDNLSENLIIELQNSAVQLISYGNGWFII